MVNERHEGKELQDITRKVEKSDEVAEIISEFEYIKKAKRETLYSLQDF